MKCHLEGWFTHARVVNSHCQWPWRSSHEDHHMFSFGLFLTFRIYFVLGGQLEIWPTKHDGEQIVIVHSWGLNFTKCWWNSNKQHYGMIAADSPPFHEISMQPISGPPARPLPTLRCWSVLAAARAEQASSTVEDSTMGQFSPVPFPKLLEIYGFSRRIHRYFMIHPYLRPLLHQRTSCRVHAVAMTCCFHPLVAIGSLMNV